MYDNKKESNCGLSEDDKKIADVVRNTCISDIVRIHAFNGLGLQECQKRVVEDLSTICVLVKQGHLIVKSPIKD